MISKNIKLLKKSGWSSDRKVSLPQYLSDKDLPEKVKAVIQNLNGLTIRCNDQDYSRKFIVHQAYLDDFDDDIEDTGLELDFYPIGHMNEYSGVIVIDQYGRFYHAGDELSFLGDNLEEFIDAVCFNERRCWLIIGDNCETYYGYKNKKTGYKFDKVKGWLGNSEFLSWNYVKENN
ncbi:SUKH-3 domain-containing protein [Shewanella sp. VB17]|uniref:SUKH-3 domain-containing protein n=1 Tax=Shewanella sp. VB17 TaxID=2739432 RepID=UPI0015633911|nr:SUKH-3 domain-containing protein [Shewanella sp. VB17]NRD75042.1 SUKH-3 domain-containing protein [Shewanella sp. VB17]